MNYHELYKMESGGGFGTFGLKIDVAVYPTLPNPKDERIRAAVYDAAKSIQNAVMRVVVESSPEAQERARLEREEILGLFDQPRAVEVPNGYCSHYCCAHLPWFKVATPVGFITAGWRKRVISIDWTQTIDTKTAEQLFPNEYVTKETRLIHAWSIEKAKQYVQAIISGNPIQ